MEVNIYNGKLGTEFGVKKLTTDDFKAYPRFPAKGDLISLGEGIDTVVYVVEQVLFNLAKYDDDSEDYIEIFTTEYEWEN